MQAVPLPQSSYPTEKQATECDCTLAWAPRWLMLFCFSSVNKTPQTVTLRCLTDCFLSCYCQQLFHDNVVKWARLWLLQTSAPFYHCSVHTWGWVGVISHESSNSEEESNQNQQAEASAGSVHFHPMISSVAKWFVLHSSCLLDCWATPQGMLTKFLLQLLKLRLPKMLRGLSCTLWPVVATQQ